MAHTLGEVESFLPPGTAAAWRTLAPVIPRFAHLAGGTAITVHLQHRISRDLDFFTEEPFDIEQLIAAIEAVGRFAPTLVEKGILSGLFEDTRVITRSD